MNLNLVSIDCLHSLEVMVRILRKQLISCIAAVIELLVILLIKQTHIQLCTSRVIGDVISLLLMKVGSKNKKKAYLPFHVWFHTSLKLLYAIETIIVSKLENIVLISDRNL